MKKIILFFLLISINIGFAQKIVPYQLPHKDFLVTVIYTVKDVKVFKKEEVIQQKSLLRHYTTISIEDPIKIEGKMRFAEDNFYFDFSRLGKRGSSFSMAFGFDSDGNGTISSFNGERQSATADIIQGTVSIVGGVIGIVAKNILPVFGINEPNSDKEVITTYDQKIEIQHLITSFDKPHVIELQPFTKQSGLYSFPFPVISGTSQTKGAVDFYYVVTPYPKVTISFEKLSTVKTTNQKLDSVSKDKIYYRVPEANKLSVKVTNNLFANEYTAIEQVVYIPQSGKLKSVPVELVGGKKTLEIGFNPITGNLSKYSFKKESSLKATLAQTKSSVDELSTAVKDLQDKVKDKNSIQSQIDQLKLDNEKLELIKKQKQLLEPDPEDENN